MTKILFSLFLAVVAISFLFAEKNIDRPKHRDFVPDAETAIRIAEAIWLPIYGKEIYQSRPFVAKLKDSTVWIVKGTLNPFFTSGGTPYIEIQKNDCKVLKVIHTQ